MPFIKTNQWPERDTILRLLQELCQPPDQDVPDALADADRNIDEDALGDSGDDGADNTIRWLQQRVCQLDDVAIDALAGLPSHPPEGPWQGGPLVNPNDISNLVDILTLLGKRIEPFVRGALRRWRQIFPRADRQWLKDGVRSHSFELAATLWMGNCGCLDHMARMGVRDPRAAYVASRQRECEDWHRLRSWPLDVSLHEFLARSVMHITLWVGGVTADDIVPIVWRTALQARERARGMLAPEVKGPLGERLEVFPVPRCTKCQTEVDIENGCLCRPDGLPVVSQPTQWFDLENSRSEAEMFRCRCPDNPDFVCRCQDEKCRCPRPLYFRVGGGCPFGNCGLPGRPVTVFVPNARRRPHQQVGHVPAGSHGPTGWVSLPDSPDALGKLLEAFDSFRNQFQQNPHNDELLNAVYDVLRNRLDASLDWTQELDEQLDPILARYRRASNRLTRQNIAVFRRRLVEFLDRQGDEVASQA